MNCIKNFLFRFQSASPYNRPTSSSYAKENDNPKLLEMARHVQSTADFVLDTPGALVFTPINGLLECSCTAFHRLKNSLRTNLEDGIVRRLVETQSNKTLPIRLLSMGSGALLSEFILLEKLALAGFKNIILDCVEPAGVSPEIIERIKDFFKETPLSLSISAYNTIDNLPSGEKDYCAVLAIDYDGCEHPFKYSKSYPLTDLIKARKRLADHGFLALGFRNEASLSGKNMDPIILTSEPCGTQNLIADLTKYFQGKNEVLIVVPHVSLEGIPLLIYALTVVTEKFPECAVSISCLHPIEDQKDKPQLLQAMLQSLFPNGNVKLSDHKKNRKYDLCLTGSLRKDCILDKCHSLLSESAMIYTTYPRGAIHRKIDNEKFVVICDSY